MTALNPISPDPRYPTLDELYANRPDSRQAMLWPVFGREGTIAYFLDYYAAVDFVNADKRTLFIGEPDYPVARLTDDLLSRKTPAVEWLEQAGPIARKLNEESKRD